MSNNNLNKARKRRNDEFYTRYEDIEEEVIHYKDQLNNKKIYLNCDNPEYSNFWKYFIDNFNSFKLQSLTATYYNEQGVSYAWVYNGINIVKYKLEGNGDFRNEENIKILKDNDIIITNPPFSLFREYVKQLIDYQKQFLIIGHVSAISYKNIFLLFKQNKISIGYRKITNVMRFTFKNKDNINISKKLLVNINNNIYYRVASTWFTNLQVNKNNNYLKLTKKYNADDYSKYDNYDAINVNKVKDIPVDYNEVMGVPITFIDKYSPNQFKIIGISGVSKDINDITCYSKTLNCFIDGKQTYKRIFIQRV